MNGSVVSLIAAVVILGFGLFSLYKLIKRAKRIKAGAGWPAIWAQVLEKKVDEDRDEDGGSSYTPQITYKYSVMGREYQGRTRMAGMWSRKGAQKAIDEIGASIELHYNPEKPEENTHSYDKVKFSEYVLIVVMLGLGLFLLWSQLR